jgi:DNA-binding XRE family transcriptional regulator
MFATEPIPTNTRLRSLRQARGWAIYGLAVRARCSPTTIGAAERWGYRPSAAVCQRIVAALEEPLEAIWPTQTPNEAGHA